MQTLSALQVKIIQNLVDEKGGAVASGDYFRNMSPSDLSAAIKLWAINKSAAIDTQIANNTTAIEELQGRNISLQTEKDNYKPILKG